MDLGGTQTLVAIIVGMTSTFGTAVLLGWKVRGWISDINIQRVISMSSLESRISMLMATHEDRYQARHEENLRSFAEVNERLARMGNGRAAPMRSP